MGQIKIIYSEKACIGAGECEAAAKSFWHVAGGKAVLRGAKKNEQGEYELVVDESMLQMNKEAANRCPSSAIKIVRM